MRKKMFRKAIFLAAAVFIVSAFPACSGNHRNQRLQNKQDSITIPTEEQTPPADIPASEVPASGTAGIQGGGQQYDAETIPENLPEKSRADREARYKRQENSSPDHHQEPEHYAPYDFEHFGDDDDWYGDPFGSDYPGDSDEWEEEDDWHGDPFGSDYPGDSDEWEEDDWHGDPYGSDYPGDDDDWFGDPYGSDFPGDGD